MVRHTRQIPTQIFVRIPDSGLRPNKAKGGAYCVRAGDRQWQHWQGTYCVPRAGRHTTTPSSAPTLVQAFLGRLWPWLTTCIPGFGNSQWKQKDSLHPWQPAVVERPVCTLSWHTSRKALRQNAILMTESALPRRFPKPLVLPTCPSLNSSEGRRFWPSLLSKMPRTTRRIDSSEWARYQEEITRLYLDRDMKLADIVIHMQRYFSFTAS